MLNNCQEIRVPIEIIKMKDLTITKKVLLAQIASLDDEEGCFATNSYFAELFNLSKTQISNIISDLKRKGWININYKYINDKNNSIRHNFEERDYSNFDWDSLYAN